MLRFIRLPVLLFLLMLGLTRMNALRFPRASFAQHSRHVVTGTNDIRREMAVSMPRTFDDPITRELIGTSESPKMELLKLNVLYLVTMLTVQTIVTAAGVFLSRATTGGTSNLLRTAVFDTRSTKLGVLFGVGLYSLGVILDQVGDWVDKVPAGAFLRKLNTGSMDFSLFLFLLGRQAPATVSTLMAIILSASSSMAEEVFFRGFLLRFLETTTGNFTLAVILSSISFGLTHCPLNWINQILEGGLGAILAIMYRRSGYNLAVPLIAHALYDFLTLYASWVFLSLFLPLPGSERERMKSEFIDKNTIY